MLLIPHQKGFDMPGFKPFLLTVIGDHQVGDHKIKITWFKARKI